MYRKLLLCLVAAGCFAVACGGDDDDDDDNGDAGAGGEAAEAGRAGAAGTGGTTAGTGGTGGNGAEGGDDNPPGGAGGQGGQGGDGGSGVSCEATDPAECVNDTTILLCDPTAGDTLQTYSCSDDFCPALGLEGGPCVAEDGSAGCECGAPLDAECAAGADELCRCFQGTPDECLTDADMFAWYLACVDGDADAEPVVRCFGEASETAQACSVTIAECVD